MEIKKDKQYIIYTNNRGNQYSFDINSGIWRNTKTQKKLKMNTPPCFMADCYCVRGCRKYPNTRIGNISTLNILIILNEIEKEDGRRQNYLLIADKLGAVNVTIDYVRAVLDMLEQFETVEKFLKYCTKKHIQIENAYLTEILQEIQTKKMEDYSMQWGIKDSQTYSAIEIVRYILRQDYNTSPYFNLIKKWINCDRIFEIIRYNDLISYIDDIIEMFNETGIVDNKTNFYHLAIIAQDWKRKNRATRFTQKATRNEDKLFFETDEFITVIPHTIEDMINEGRQQQNCIGRLFVDAIIAEYTNIVFIRKKNDIDKSLISCEVYNNGLIAQFLKAHNSRVYPELDKEYYEFQQAYQEHLYKTFGV